MCNHHKKTNSCGYTRLGSDIFRLLMPQLSGMKLVPQTDPLLRTLTCVLLLES